MPFRAVGSLNAASQAICCGGSVTYYVKVVVGGYEYKRECRIFWNIIKVGRRRRQSPARLLGRAETRRYRDEGSDNEEKLCIVVGESENKFEQGSKRNNKLCSPNGGDWSL